MEKSRTIEAENSEQLIRTVARGGGIAFAGNIVGRGIGFFLQILFGRVLGASGYGLYSLGDSLTKMGSQLSMLGLGTGVVRFVALYSGVGDTRRVKGTLVSAFAVSIFLSVVVGGLMFLFAGRISQMFDKPGLAPVLRVFTFAIPFYVTMLMVASSARAFKLVKYDVAIRSIFRPLINIIIVSTAFLLGFRLLGAVSSFSISSACSSFIALYILRRMFPEITSNLKPHYQIREMIRFSIPVLLVGFSYFLLGETDRIMLGYFRGPEDLGVYSMANNFSRQIGLIAYSFNHVFSPTIADLYNRNEIRAFKELFKVVARWVFICSGSSLNEIISRFRKYSKCALYGITGSNGVRPLPV